jgi:hypothetical protein
MAWCHVNTPDDASEIQVEHFVIVRIIYNYKRTLNIVQLLPLVYTDSELDYIFRFSHMPSGNPSFNLRQQT